jgi:NAD(P)-dependent dehydrogenase (short-subunit alcohol dehydrogenase family)
LVFDLTDREAAQRVANELRERPGGVDIVVQNGAYMPRAGGPARDDARPMIEANSHGTLAVLRSDGCDPGFHGHGLHGRRSADTGGEHDHFS